MKKVFVKVAFCVAKFAFYASEATGKSLCMYTLLLGRKKSGYEPIGMSKFYT